MDSGFYAACAGLRAQSQALEVSAHNLANVNTAGFRGQQTTFQSLLAVANPTVPTVLNLATNNFGVLEGSHLDLTAGTLQHTGNPLDLGIEGAGFFAIQTAGGTRYTRNGSFRVASSRELVTASGDPVQRRGCGQHPVCRVRSGDPADLRRRDSNGRPRRERPTGQENVCPGGHARVFERECHYFCDDADRSAAARRDAATRSFAV